MNRMSLVFAVLLLGVLVGPGQAHADPAFCGTLKKAFSSLDGIKKPNSDQAKKVAATVSGMLSKGSPPAELRISIVDFTNGLKVAANAIGNKADAKSYAQSNGGKKYVKATQVLLQWAGTKCPSTK